ncbi:MAG: (2Fe-2S) ferredoxin domain-containing protein [Deltaproteobacteria bacterium]|nr:(2Fe-2S) ferredoxin domain-containing protein [Deltaproteobacteria bacterium]
MATPLEIIKKKRAQAIHRIIEKGYLTTRVYVGMATCEIAAGSQEVMAVFEKAVRDGQIKNVYLSQKGCAGRCNLEPMVEIIEEGKIPVKYQKVSPDKARDIIDRHLINGKVIEEWVIQ